MGNENTLATRNASISFLGVLSHFFRIAIALLLITSGLLHLQNVPAHFVAIANYRIVPVPVSRFLGFGLPSLHVVVGVSLLLSENRWLCYLSSVGLFGIYMTAQLSVLLRGLRIDCGCLGPSASSTIGVDTVSKTAFLLIVSIWLAWQEEDRPHCRVLPHSSRQSNDRKAITLIELLVCISMIGLLIALILPAVQSARESGRRTSCSNNQRQLVLAVQLHEGTNKAFPSTGWGYNWVGMHDQGTGKRQPGSWIYAVLPLIEQTSLWSASPTVIQPHTSDNFQRYVIEKVPQLICPSKGLGVTLPANVGVAYRYGSNITMVSRSDYAVNAGDKLLENNAGPVSVNDVSFVWPRLGNPSGMAYVRSEVRHSDVTDGTTNVIYCGEKWSERTGLADRGYDQPWSTGDSQESRRFTEKILLRDGSKGGELERFGSSHAGGGVFGFVDGSVHIIHFSIHPTVFRTLGNRFDGNDGVGNID